MSILDFILHIGKLQFLITFPKKPKDSDIKKVKELAFIVFESLPAEMKKDKQKIVIRRVK